MNRSGVAIRLRCCMPMMKPREQHEQMGFFEGWNIVIDQLNDLALTLR